MPKSAGRIIKAGDVELEGQFRLDIGGFGTKSLREKRATFAVPQVRIMENHPEFAVIEVTCGCGVKTCLRCEFAGGQAPEGKEAQSGVPAVSKQVSDKTK